MPRPKSPEQVLVEHLEKSGYRVERDLPHQPHVVIPVRKATHFRWAFISCTHLGGKYQQLTHLRDFCKRAVDQGVTDIFHVGDVTNGSSRKHNYVYENFKHGATAQIEYAAEVLPQHEGIKWHLLSGNHDDWWDKTEGIESVRHIAQRREDMEYLGKRAMWLRAGPLSMYVRHASGGLGYALTYKLQRSIERMNPRPDIYAIANWHSAAHAPGYGGSELIMTPCFQAQTPYEDEQGLTPTIGGLILDIDVDKSNVWSIRPNWVIYKTAIDHDY